MESYNIYFQVQAIFLRDRIFISKFNATILSKELRDYNLRHFQFLKD
ncbi:hypothetical protein LEP1GSC191_0658 [Leptospira borgpetersenii serovar Mini str. 201000851]|uniref:Uncharacterized protein n=3 Tax=Leptospira borgpetersenii TaxID=174 RepID=M3FHJ2_LEPBO|nr:hypothetical protein LEP1GSC128_2148 [Leptospira borgpetersenii str. 200801926]EMG01298.1 hypothetical protein LEP1GSC123_3820 [Leptospira borgpetersenii str. 200701203]EMK11461.1 hypothetical protein LEP1GSC066_1754 [Leptospira sp. serovar Kenya str. Sh9]EMN13830.1 hypothetical protein LEP1GSC055_1382 [Leptospira borgpetersenii str. Brem 307]EMN18170.1 hypothetical protein LEP1GSC056_1642 [Leptospira borgpetersenii str. Brem 328]ENO64629.1 hypothetical protein LEP1GSC191_0658 [Leptospira b